MSDYEDEGLNDFIDLEEGARSTVGKPIYDLRNHIDTLQRRHGEWDGFDEEFKQIEDRSASHRFFGDFRSAHKVQNRTKNRYSDVLPLEETRIKLTTTNNFQASDYINANYINGEIDESEKQYIATQGPLEETIYDFWRMCWIEKVKVVIMLTRLVEGDRIKCHRYWPRRGKQEWNEYTIEVIGGIEKESENIIRRTFKLSHTPSGKSRNIEHFQYRDWPDHGLPSSTLHFRELLRIVKKRETSDIPLVVHCSAGIGRTGTFCTVHSTLQLFEKEKEDGKQISCNIMDTVLRLRTERVGMVQTKEQYMLCYIAILEEAADLGIM